MLNELKLRGFCGLEGHRSKGGIRATMYNSLPYESVDELCNFLEGYVEGVNRE
jgi:phosphoserine aminotransferase